MPEIDDDTMARVLQWCAEAGRRSSPDEVRAALSGLSWDALLAVRAVLADDPPARPLGPFALVDVARGVAPDVAARREEEHFYGSPHAGGEPAPEPAAATGAEPPPAEKKATRGRATRRVATVVIRRARDRREEEPPSAPPPPVVDELFASEGRPVLERWIRRHGARREPILAELSRWRRPDGNPAGGDDLARLLDAHGLARAFERREREEVLHAVRAAGGQLAVAARALGGTPESLQATADRLGIARDVEAVREERREDIRRRATLGDRVRLLVDEAERIADLGMTAEVEEDVRRRLGEHLKALRAADARHLQSSFARTLGITRDQAGEIAQRFRLDVREHAAPPRRAGAPPARASAPPTRHGNAGPARHGNAGPARHGNAGPARHGSAGPARHGSAGPARHGSAGPAHRAGATTSRRTSAPPPGAAPRPHGPGSRALQGRRPAGTRTAAPRRGPPRPRKPPRR